MKGLGLDFADAAVFPDDEGEAEFAVFGADLADGAAEGFEGDATEFVADRLFLRFSHEISSKTTLRVKCKSLTALLLKLHRDAF